MHYPGQANSRIPARTFRELHDWQMAKCPVWAVAQSRPSGDGRRWLSAVYVVTQEGCQADHEWHETAQSAMVSAVRRMKAVRKEWR